MKDTQKALKLKDRHNDANSVYGKNKNGCGHKYKNVIADAGYASEENYTYLEQQSQSAYIKPTDYDVRKTRKFRNNKYRTENLDYDLGIDSFICPNGKRLSFAYESHRF